MTFHNEELRNLYLLLDIIWKIMFQQNSAYLSEGADGQYTEWQGGWSRLSPDNRLPIYQYFLLPSSSQ
jgi:hypothetical protein